jgi:dephospho-CoA kinase
MTKAGGARRVALTGGIATGKSHVRAHLEALGVPTIDADALARQAVAPGTAGLAAVVRRFGREILLPDGSLNRRSLAQTVFSDMSARRDLEAIIHPAVRAAIDAWFERLNGEGAPIGVADIPLLYEAGREREFELVIVAACAPATQLRRLIERDALSETEARARLAAQLPVEEKARRADYVVGTDGSIAETNRQVEAVWRQITTG